MTRATWAGEAGSSPTIKTERLGRFRGYRGMEHYEGPQDGFILDDERAPTCGTALTFRTRWSEEGKEYVGLCDRLPSMSFLADTREGAFAGVLRLVAEEFGDGVGVRPIGDRVLIRRDPKKTQIGLIHTPDGSEVWPPTGVVLAVGPDVEETAIRPGARVIFATPKTRPARALIPDDRDPGQRDNKRWERVIVIEEDDVVAVLETDVTGDMLP